MLTVISANRITSKTLINYCIETIPCLINGRLDCCRVHLVELYVSVFSVFAISTCSDFKASVHFLKYVSEFQILFFYRVCIEAPSFQSFASGT